MSKGESNEPIHEQDVNSTKHLMNSNDDGVYNCGNDKIE